MLQKVQNKHILESYYDVYLVTCMLIDIQQIALTPPDLSLYLYLYPSATLATAATERDTAATSLLTVWVSPLPAPLHTVSVDQSADTVWPLLYQ